MLESYVNGTQDRYGAFDHAPRHKRLVMVGNTVILAIARAIVYYLILSRIYQTPFSSKRTNISSRQTIILFFVMSDNLMDVTRTVPDVAAVVAVVVLTHTQFLKPVWELCFHRSSYRWSDYLTWSSISCTRQEVHIFRRCQEVNHKRAGTSSFIFRSPNPMAEVGGFEPSRRFHALTVFKTVLFNRLSTPPNIILLVFSMILC